MNMGASASTKRTPAPKAGVRRSQKAVDAPAEGQEHMPTPEDIAVARQTVEDFIQATRFARFRNFVAKLAERPPQVLLFEGGTTQERKVAASYWALMLNCQNASAETPPCLMCTDCIRLFSYQHRDLFFMDGSTATIKIDDVRELRSVLGEPPREARFRVVVFHESQSLLEAAANSLLKSLEEPKERTSFVLLAPQRERLLPTLVSRSMCLTLPWPEPSAVAEELTNWEAVLCTFFQTGKKLFALSGTKGEVTPEVVLGIIQIIRRALTARILSEQTGTPPCEGLEQALQRIPFSRLRIVDEVLAESQDSLIYTVNPVLVLEWMATRLFLLISGSATSKTRTPPR